MFKVVHPIEVAVGGALVHRLRDAGALPGRRLPFPEVNVRIGPGEVDALWRDVRLIVEVDGGDGHATRAQMQRDRERDLRLRDVGFSVLRYSGRRITHQRPAVAADIGRALQSRAYA